MAANIKGIFLNNTININTYLVTWNFIDEKNKTKILNRTMFILRKIGVWTLNHLAVT